MHIPFLTDRALGLFQQQSVGSNPGHDTWQGTGPSMILLCGNLGRMISLRTESLGVLPSVEFGVEIPVMAPGSLSKARKKLGR